MSTEHLAPARSATRSRRCSHAPRIAFVLAAFAAFAARAGDPVPDVDVILEQVPGGFLVESVGGGFDRLVLGGSRGFVDGLAPEKLPPGWALTRQGRNAVLSAAAGTPTDRPVRFRLAVETRPERGVDWDVSYAGRSLARAKAVVPRLAPPFETRNSIAGVVEVSGLAGLDQPLTFRASSPLPPGTFVLSGTVVEEFEEEEWASMMRGVNKTRSNIKGRMAAPPRDGIVLEPQDGATCANLAGLAAALSVELEGGPGDGPAVFRVARTEAATQASRSYHLRDLSSLSKAKHEAAMAAIRNIKGIAAPVKSDPRGGSGEGRPGGQSRAFYAVTGGGPADSAALGIAINEEEDLEIAINEEEDLVHETFDVTSLHGAHQRRITVSSRAPTDVVGPTEIARMAKPRHDTTPAKPDRPSSGDAARLVALRVEESAAGCRYTSREPTDLDLARTIVNTTRSNIKSAPDRRPPPPPKPPSGQISGTVYAVDLPEDLAPGSPLSLQYFDLFGDLVLDVPRLPVDVAPPRAPGEAPPVPCITSATPWVAAGGSACICGSFPSPAAGWNLLVNERPAPGGSIQSVSSSVVWLRLPETAAPGRHFLSGRPDDGFAPSCKATTDRIEISGEIDSTRLQRGESVPMRLTVIGSEQSIPLRLRNASPAIVQLEGGDDQSVETSGGSPNRLERTVRALQRGSFDIQWTPVPPPCPCGSTATIVDN